MSYTSQRVGTDRRWTALCDVASGIDQSSPMSSSLCGRSLEQRASASANESRQVVEHFLHMVRVSSGREPREEGVDRGILNCDDMGEGFVLLLGEQDGRGVKGQGTTTTIYIGVSGVLLMDAGGIVVRRDHNIIEGDQATALKSMLAAPPFTTTDTIRHRTLKLSFYPLCSCFRR
ncbi:hypothetical protein GW17_00032961 [Ensete ventricosum]|nr:hypothetical protein GW17_00032961 [Ensete ventricosum]